MLKLSNNFIKRWFLVVSLFIMMLSFLIAGNLFVAKADGPVMNFEAGASIRINSDGLRFRVEIDENTRNYIVDNDNVTMGFFMAPTELMTAVQDGKYENMAKKIEVSVNEAYIYPNDNGNYFVNGCVYNFKLENRAKDYTAVAFIKEDNGYVYSELSDSRGIYSTLNLFITANKESKTTVQKVMDTYDWFGTANYPIVIADETDYANICALVNAGITFENLYLKVTDELFVADMPSGFNGNFTTDSEKIFNYGYKANTVGEKTVGTVELPTANKVDSANQIVEENVVASKVTFNGAELVITNNTIEATEVGVYKVTFAGDENTIETTIDLFVREAGYADEIETFSDELFGSNFYLSEETYFDSTERNATVEYLENYSTADGVVKLTLNNSGTQWKTFGFAINPRSMTQAELAEFDYVVVRAYLEGTKDYLHSFRLGGNTLELNDTVANENAPIVENGAFAANGWYEFRIPLTEAYKAALATNMQMSLEIYYHPSYLVYGQGDMVIYIDSIIAEKTSFGAEIIAQDANADGEYALNEEVTLSIAGINNAKFTVVAPNGDKVAVVDNKFTPTEVGQYTITSNYLSVASKKISVSIVRVPFVENEIEAFSDELYGANFYLSEETYFDSTERNATVEYLESCKDANGVVKLTLNNSGTQWKTFGFAINPRSMTQAELAEFDYVVVRAYLEGTKDYLHSFRLGGNTLVLNDTVANENAPIVENGAFAANGWYEFRIPLTEAYKAALATNMQMSLEIYYHPSYLAYGQGDMVIYIDSIMAGKNA